MGKGVATKDDFTREHAGKRDAHNFNRMNRITGPNGAIEREF
ncbi:hypothetical protein RSSM_05068 [Rhodopirellula sallentina SM41]|uniref:Uncharacterized protein n=1 Tax=Rhodopirellula sallentina SM41 TaxID=1263870 RepID=M5TWU4_9BACT|nr:hypothetical protein RSSM_05068 [Rhodopirellula sallentina SM41]